MFKSLRACSFSLNRRVPKQAPLAESSFLSSIFHRSKSSPTYGLLFELFGYLQSTRLIGEYFPYLKTEPRFETNLMLAHCVLLLSRLVQWLVTQKQDLPSSELANYQHNLKAYFFLPYAKFVEKGASPAGNFDYHFVDAYEKRMAGVQRELGRAEAVYVDSKSQLRNYELCFAEAVYERKVGEGFRELAALSKYYLAHVRYLQSLSFDDMIKYKVHWGLGLKPEAIDSFVKDTN